MKRTKLDELSTINEEKIKCSKKEKKFVEKVKIGENTNYTIQNYFNSKEEENVVQQFKLNSKKIELGKFSQAFSKDKTSQNAL